MARVLAAALLTLLSQEKKEAPRPVPKVLVCAPPAAVPGQATKILVRGMNLDTATDVKVEGAAEVKLKGKAKVPVAANTDPEILGNSQVEIEVGLAADAKEEKLSVVVTTPVDTAPPHALRVVAAERLVAEKEPNGGFAQAQALEPGKVLQGAVGAAKDVDVFSVQGKKGETWVFEVTAQRLGSPLDPILTLYDPSGQVLASKDDAGDSRDAALKAVLPADGTYRLSLIDAHDQGGATHVYHLTASRP
jgi:hypothetical protein